MKRISFLSLVIAFVLLLGVGCQERQSENTSTTVVPPTDNVDSNAVMDSEMTKPTSTDAESMEPEREQVEVEIPESSAVKQPVEQKEVSKPETQPTPEKVVVPEVKTFTMTAQTWSFEPSTITVKKGDQVRLNITSVDVEHGFALGAYGINVTLPPNTTKTIEFSADKVGTFKFSCSVFCGAGHSDMDGTLVVTE